MLKSNIELLFREYKAQRPFIYMASSTSEQNEATPVSWLAAEAEAI